MNADHADALVVLCHHEAGRPGAVSASMTAVDRYGFEVIADLGAGHREAFRIGSRSPQHTPEGVRRELVAMQHAVRSR